jgi:hypothetical protein
MWKLTEVAEASPVIVCVVASTCFRSIYTVVFAAIAVVVCNATALSASVNVAAVPAVFVTAIFETTVVVDEGTVYSVVLDVAAAVLASTFVNVAISYYLSG